MPIMRSGARRATVLLAGALGCILVATCGCACASVPLPDGRAWEMVSPLTKNGGDVEGSGQESGGGIDQAAAGGEAVSYVAESSFAEPEGGGASQYLSHRTAKGWTTQNITAPEYSGTVSVAGGGRPYKAFSSDLSRGLFENGSASEEAPVENPPLLPGMPLGYQNFYVRESSDGALRALLTAQPPSPPQLAREFYMHLEGASPDLRHIVVASDSALTHGAIVNPSLGTKYNLYEWFNGEWQAVNVLPGVVSGETTPEATLGSEFGGESHMVSDDGSRVFWSNAKHVQPVVADELFVREDGATTVQLDASRGGASLPGEEKETIFQTASSDGSLAFFTSHAPLTEDANTGPPAGAAPRQGNDLYAFDVLDGTLRDLTPDHNPADPDGAEVQGVLGASADGSYVYFVATAALTGANAEGRSPSSAYNLYMWHEAPGRPPITFIASLTGADEAPEAPEDITLTHDWSRQVLFRNARVASSGNAVAFMSAAELTGYDNHDAVTGQPDEEVYVYDAATGRLSCASCNPSGARPLGPASIPAGARYENRGGVGAGAIYEPRSLSEDGRRLFFDSSDPLVPQATNGAQNVYEYEDGHVYLLSGGQSEESSEFVDASANGDDAFFLTRQELVPGDTDQLVDLYDARAPHEPGEVVAFPEPPPPPSCEGEDCKPEASPQLFFAPSGSAVFKGAGNVPPPVPAPATKAKAKKKAKPKPRHKAKSRRAKRSRVARRRR